MKQTLFLVVCYAVLASSSLKAQTLTTRTITDFPGSLAETSGLFVPTSDSVWSHNDSGGEAKLILIDTFGTKVRELTVAGATNVDWEDLISSDDGYLYVGDFGNNFENRTNLKLYRIQDPSTVFDDAVFGEIINFNYEDQTAFPPPFGQWYFDCESGVVWDDNIFLFTKDWSVPLIGFTRIYTLPKTIGTHTATFFGSFYTDNSTYAEGGVTSAALSPDKSKLVLISNRKLWLFFNFTGQDFLNGSVWEYDFPENTQKEAVSFLSDNCTLYISDEKTNSTGGKLYTFNTCELLTGQDDVALAPSNLSRVWANTKLQTLEIHWRNFEPTHIEFLNMAGQILWHQAVLPGQTYFEIQRLEFSTSAAFVRLTNAQQGSISARMAH